MIFRNSSWFCSRMYRGEALRLGVKSLARDDLPIARQRKYAC